MVGDFFRNLGDKVADVLHRDKEVIPFPTYGYQKGGAEGGWVISLRIWVNKARRLPIPDEVIGVFTRDLGHLDADDVKQLRGRIKHFVADDDSDEEVSVKFDDDPDDQTHVLPTRTDENGLVKHDLEISAGKAQQLLDAQGSTSGWLSFTASAESFDGKGRARLVGPRGLSIISDIDDTIKVTEVPSGKHVVLRNVFLRDYETTPRMADMYRAFGGDVMFHYVSGSPWQLYKILGDFLVGDSEFPEGAFHMKDVGKNLRVAENWENFKKFTEGDKATLVQKEEQITRIFQNLPEREFILIGDSGEKDPEVFSRIRDAFPTRVRKIFIRDVLEERHKADSTRLDRMAVIDPEGNVFRDVEPEGFGVTRFAD
ncbi:MAG TPA: phosphatase domain-containing protein [Pyrinomonadaceae bacterium]